MQRRLLVTTMLAAVACKGGGDKNGATPASTPQVAAGPSVPKVAAATVLAADDGTPPPLLVVIDDPKPLAPNENVLDMKVRVAAVKSWADLAKRDPTAGSKEGNVDLAFKVSREAHALGETPEHAIEAWATGPHMLTADQRDVDSDDPPPPPPEDQPDDGKDESGGTGTAMALDEGKMGKKDSDRAEGQYKMRKTAEEAEPQRGGLMQLPEMKGTPADADPERVADVLGKVMTDGKLNGQLIAIVATPRTNAQRLARVLGVLEGELVVSAPGAVRPLHIDFTHQRDPSWLDVSHWVEVRVGTAGFTVEAVPDAPIEVTDPKELAPAIDKARAARKLSPAMPVDLLFDPGADAQRVVDLVVALDTAGIRYIGIGSAPTPGSDQAKRRGHRNPTLHMGQPNAQGDLDKKAIRHVIAAAKPQLFACYAAELAKQPELTGTISAMFFITPTGKVASASASGVDPAVATCVEGVIRKLEFPKPKGGGGVQVNFPFTFRP